MKTEDLIDIGMTIFAFWLGGKTKENQMRNEISEAAKECEINLLKQRLAEIEKNPSTTS